MAVWHGDGELEQPENAAPESQLEVDAQDERETIKRIVKTSKRYSSDIKKIVDHVKFLEQTLGTARARLVEAKTFIGETVRVEINGFQYNAHERLNGMIERIDDALGRLE